MSKESAFNWLWGTSILNLGLGAILWGWNSAALSIGDFDWSGEQMNAVVWQGIGSGFWGFGVLVFVITLATSAVVGAIEENPKSLVRNGNSNSPGDRGPGEARIPESRAKGNNNQLKKSVVQWLKEEEK